NGGITGLSTMNSGDRTLETRAPISARDNRIIQIERNAGDIRTALSRPESARTFAADRTLADTRQPLANRESERAFYNEPIARTVSDLRDRISRTDNLRMLATASPTSTPNIIPAGEQQQKTP